MEILGWCHNETKGGNPRQQCNATKPLEQSPGEGAQGLTWIHPGLGPHIGVALLLGPVKLSREEGGR